MSFPFPIQGSYTGIVRDVSRDQLPAGAVWNLQDYFPNILGAPLRKRGGWVYGSPALAGTGVNRMINAEFTAGAKLLALDNQATPVLWVIASSASASSAGAVTANGQPVFYANKVVFPNSNGTSTIQTYDGTTIASVTAAPTGKYAAVYKDRVLLANTNAQPQYVYFSAAGDPTTWDTTNGWIQVSRPIVGIAALKNAVLVLATSRTERIRGTTPPPGSDMVLEGVSDYGCDDDRSIDLWGDAAIYADTQGVYQCDGTTTIDLTAAGGIQTFWRSQLAAYTSSWHLVGHVFRNYYLIAILNGSTFVDCFVCDLSQRQWFRMQNFPFLCFAGVRGAFQDLYAGLAAANRAVRVTDIFSPAAGNKADADGTNVLPVVEYPMARGFIRVRRRWFPSQGITNWRRVYLSYDIRDSGADNPALQLSYVQTPEATSYTALAPNLAASTAATRGARSFGGASARGGKTSRSMLGVKVAQVNPSSDTRLYTLEAEYQTQGTGKLAQS